MMDILLGTMIAAALVLSVAMLLLRHPMRVALALVGVMLSLAVIYGVMEAHVIAASVVLIHVGAVMVFMIYIIMLLDIRDISLVRRFNSLAFWGIALGVLVIGAISSSGCWTWLTGSGQSELTLFRFREFSKVFLGRYWFHFELASILLLVAVVAAVTVLKLKDKEDDNA